MPRRRPDAPEVSSRELQALRVLGWAQQRRRMSDLAASMRVPLSTASRVIDRLARKGLVERDGGDDRRTVHVRFSRHGLKLGRFLMEWRIETAAAMLDKLPRLDRRELLAALERIAAQQDNASTRRPIVLRDASRRQSQEPRTRSVFTRI